MGIISWVVVGAIAGWIASMIMGGKARMGLLTNIIVGVVGAFIGGYVLQLLGIGAAVTGINLNSILVAVLGACILLFIVNKVK